MAVKRSQGRRIEIRGTVQGVGFRPWVYQLATRAGIGGNVRNAANGVVIHAFAEAHVLAEFTDRLQSELPAAAQVTGFQWHPISAVPTQDFCIDPSEPGEQQRPSIPPDLATCPDCLRELRDRTDRRYRYPFINCTACGPRFTIALQVPYDRSSTTMAGFAMCDACRQQYDDPNDRRFHAQPIACPDCGPVLTLRDEGGLPLPAEDPIRGAATVLQQGGIVAIKGLGGFHLACDATDESVVQKLRQRKHRDEKPFAVMVRDIEAAALLAAINEEEGALLTSVQRPIVLLRRLGRGVAPAVAPDTTRLGLMLPYTPLHQMLLEAVDVPLVMTSGNLSDEPIAVDNTEALKRLRGIADRFVLHQRDIASRVDDSVATVIAGRPLLLRRSRGWVPRPVALCRPVARPTLGVGGQLKSTFCLAVSDAAYLGPHIGDLDSLDAYESFETALERMQRFIGVRPEVIAHDLHPDYLSTRYAKSQQGATCIGVQHHHAHIVSTMAEHALVGPVFGVAYDGTGLGTDGTAWGGEVLMAQTSGFTRLATFRPIRLPGGDMAIRQVWRIALAALVDAFGPNATGIWERLALSKRVAHKQTQGVLQLLRQQVQAPLCHGVGRWFDALGAMGLDRAVSTYEGQVAMAWESAAADHGADPYEAVLDTSALPWLIDMRPAVRSAALELLDGRHHGEVAAAFHETLISATLEVLRLAVDSHGPLPVVLSGGCFQNARLTEGLLTGLKGFDRELASYCSREAPPGDGGLALGQVVVADSLDTMERRAS